MGGRLLRSMRLLPYSTHQLTCRVDMWDASACSCRHFTRTPPAVVVAAAPRRTCGARGVGCARVVCTRCALAVKLGQDGASCGACCVAPAWPRMQQAACFEPCCVQSICTASWAALPSVMLLLPELCASKLCCCLTCVASIVSGHAQSQGRVLLRPLGARVVRSDGDRGAATVSGT